MSDSIKIECWLDRESAEVSITLHSIPLDDLDRVLREIATKTWRTNVVDGIRGQWVAGGPEMPMSERKFHTYADEEES